MKFSRPPAVTKAASEPSRRNGGGPSCSTPATGSDGFPPARGSSRVRPIASMSVSAMRARSRDSTRPPRRPTAPMRRGLCARRVRSEQGRLRAERRGCSLGGCRRRNRGGSRLGRVQQRLRGFTELAVRPGLGECAYDVSRCGGEQLIAVKEAVHHRRAGAWIDLAGALHDRTPRGGVGTNGASRRPPA